jgi:hypothetical protein
MTLDTTVLTDDDNTDHIQPTKDSMVLYISSTHLMQLNSCVKLLKMFELADGALAGNRFFQVVDKGYTSLSFC